MKKNKNYKFLRYQKRRERKRLTRLRTRGYFKHFYTPEYKEVKFKKDHDDIILGKHTFELEDFLNKNGNSTIKKPTTEITIPKTFSLEEDYDSTIEILALIRKSLIKYKGEDIKIDFSNCIKVDFSSLFLLKVLLDEYLENSKRLDQKVLIYKVIPNIIITHSKNSDVNLKLLANKLIPITSMGTSDFIPISSLDMITGTRSQRHYAENKKGVAATKIRKYINTGLNRHNFSLNEKGDSFLDGMISEILNNAEDHSPFNKWYAFANLFETKRNQQNTEVVGEINLAFLNFGYSIFEGFEETKIQNKKTYNEMDALHRMVSETLKGKKYSKENLFTLYALQEGNSRLKFEEESRGTGTMKFINSFLNLGDYQDELKGYVPHLLIYSGSTMLKCDNKYQPFSLDGAFYLSLNDENDMTHAPESSHLKTLDNRFPGTLLIGKIYLNESHLKKKIVDNGN